MDRANFGRRWNRTAREPEIKRVAVKKLEPKISLESMVEEIERTVEKAQRQGRVKKEDFVELMRYTRNLKTVLKKVDKGKNLVAAEIRERAKLRVTAQLRRR